MPRVERPSGPASARTHTTWRIHGTTVPSVGLTRAYPLARFRPRGTSDDPFAPVTSTRGNLHDRTRPGADRSHRRAQLGPHQPPRLRAPRGSCSASPSRRSPRCSPPAAATTTAARPTRPPPRARPRRPRRRGHGHRRGHRRCAGAAARSASPARSRPARSTRWRCRTSAPTASSPSASSSSARSATTATSRPGLAEIVGARTTTAASGRSTLRQGVKWQDGTDFTSADVAATHGPPRRPPATPASRASSTRARSTPPIRRRRSSRSLGPNGNFPYLVSVYNAQSVITPGRVRARAPRSTRRRTAPARGSSPSSTPPPAPRSTATPTGGAATRRSARRRGASSTTRARWSPPPRPARSTRSSSSRSSAARRCSTTPTSTSWASRPPPTARSGCAATPASSPTSGCARRSATASTARQLIETLFQGKADIGNDHVIAPLYPFFDDPSTPQRTRDIDEGQGAAGRGRVPRRAHGRRCTSVSSRRSPSWRS